MDELQKQLESASAERDELKNQNEKLLEELKNSRQHIDNANNILDKYSEELSGSFSAAKKEIDNSIAEIAGQLENFRKAFDSFNSNINANKAEQKNISDISVSDAMNENTDMSTHAAEYLEDISEYDTDTEGSGNKAEDIEQLNNSLSGYNNSSDLIFSEDSLEENNLDYILTASDELQEDEFLTFMPDKKNNISNDFDLSDDLYEILINSENNQFQENENNLEANLKKAYSHSDIVSDSDEGMEEVPL